MCGMAKPWMLNDEYSEASAIKHPALVHHPPTIAGCPPSLRASRRSVLLLGPPRRLAVGG